MSNYLAIASVTEVLRQLLHSAIQRDVPGVAVNARRPGAIGGQPGTEVTIYLYRVSPNAALRNADLPTRSSDGKQLMRRPQVALDLHYLLSFYGEEGEFMPQRLLGSVVAALQLTPTLNRRSIREMLGGHDLLGESDLAGSIELVKLSMVPLSLEDLSKLWSVFLQTPHALSVAYEASVVLVEPNVVPPEPLRVRDGNIYGRSLRQPLIEQLRVAGDTLEIRGQRLRGPATQVWVGEQQLPAGNLAVNDSLITVALPVDVPAGLQSVQVVHTAPLGAPPAQHRVAESNALPCVVRPRIQRRTGEAWAIDLLPPAAGERAPTVRVQIDPPRALGQRAQLLLNEYRLQPFGEQPARAYSFGVPPRAADEPGDLVSARMDGALPGTYLVRVRVDGAESLLEYGADPADPAETKLEHYYAPKVIIP